ncbi:DUF4340 domain-containing protein [Gemmatimonadota bacterium]
MSSSTRKLLITFGILLVVTIVWNSLERRRTTSRISSFEDVAIEEVTRIAISGKGNDVTLEQRGGVWLITSPIEYPANQTLVEDLLGKVDELATVNVVSSNPVNHDLFEVGAETGVLVQLYGGREGNRRMMSMFVGKMTSDFNHTFIRRFSEDDVHTASGLLNGYFNKTVSAWQDRTIFALPAESITQLNVIGEEVDYTLAIRGIMSESPDVPWVIQSEEGLAEADSSKAMAIVRRVAGLSASGFPEPGDLVDADWENPVIRIDGRLVDGSAIELRVCEIPGDSSRYYVRKSGDETVFLIYRSNLDPVLKQREDLIVIEEG